MTSAADESSFYAEAHKITTAQQFWDAWTKYFPGTSLRCTDLCVSASYATGRSVEATFQVLRETLEEACQLDPEFVSKVGRSRLTIMSAACYSETPVQFHRMLDSAPLKSFGVTIERLEISLYLEDAEVAPKPEPEWTKNPTAVYYQRRKTK